MGQAELLRQAAGDAPDGVRAVKIADAAERCARIVRNLLDLARRRPPERRRVDLNRLLRESLGLAAYSLRGDSVHVTMTLADDVPPIWADPHQLQQVVVNLVTNAHYAMRHHGTPRRLSLSTCFDPVRARVHFEVADTGPGIPPEIRRRIFEPFFTTKPVGQGSGLGLALCQGIVTGHAGSICAETRPGQGAASLVELPAGSPPVPSAGEARAEAAPAVQGKRILVVDDEPMIAEVLVDLLAADGHRVDKATSGVRALEWIRAGAYDLIISDIKMPGLDGPGLYRELERRHPALARRVVFVTGNILDPEVSAFLEAAGAPSFAKPFALEEVRRLVQQVLRAAPGTALDGLLPGERR